MGAYYNINMKEICKRIGLWVTKDWAEGQDSIKIIQSISSSLRKMLYAC